MQISLRDIDFLSADYNSLKLKEEEGMYPPHFPVVVDGSGTTQKTLAHITFTGATNDLFFDIHLVPATQGKPVGYKLCQKPVIATFKAYNVCKKIILLILGTHTQQGLQ